MNNGGSYSKALDYDSIDITVPNENSIATFSKELARKIVLEATGESGGKPSEVL